jgi:hypothetical protein
MAFLVSALLPYVACLLLVIATSVVWWRTLQSPWVFVVVGLLAVLGVHRVLQLATELGKTFGGRGYFLEAPTTAAAVQLAQKGLLVEALATSAALLVLGFPLLLWLKRALPTL